MSVILITKHDENIYNITKEATTFHKKSPRYKSSFRDRIHREMKLNRNVKSHANMGRAREPLPDPASFLKKRSWKPPMTLKPPTSECRGPHCPKKTKLPSVPCTKTVVKEQEDKLKSRRIKKNYIVENVQTLLKMKPKEPVKKIVIDRHGHTKDCQGLEHMDNPVFGKTPTYLQKVIEKNQRNLQRIKDSTGTEQPKCRYITRAERDKLLAGLKKNWEELQKQYQGLPILTDTIPKINRKSKMEADLKQLEKDIVLIERHQYIYVYDDDDMTN